MAQQSQFLFTAPLAAVSSLLFYSTAIAQVIPDNSLGGENSTVRQETIKGIPSELIEGGATRGANLFHSFLEFNIKEGRGAYFANPAAIENILSRVTGGNASQILGTLGVLGNANLFLLNPNGIVFGANARLDLRGSFFASTADSLVFANGFQFSASNPQAPPLLTVNIPIGLRFREKAADISSAGNLAVPGDLSLKAENLDLSGSLQAGGNLSLEALNTVKIRDSVVNPFVAAAGVNLLLQGNQGVDIFALNHPNSGLFSGGDMVLRSANTVGGDAHYWSGGSFRIEKLDGSLGDLSSPHDPVIRTQGDVFINAYKGASLHILAGGNVQIGSVWITGADPIFGLVETVTLSNGQPIAINGKTEATVDIRAGVKPDAIGSPFLSGTGTDTFVPPTNFTPTPSSADINIGTIFFADAASQPFAQQPKQPTIIPLSVAGKVLLTNQYQPNAELQGNIQVFPTLNMPNSPLFGVAINTSAVSGGGTVAIDSRGSVTVNGRIQASALPISFLPSGFPVVQENGGDVTLLANGNINFFTPGSIFSDGALGGNITLNSQADISVTNSPLLNRSYTQSIGSKGGDTTFTARSLSLTSTCCISTTTFGGANAGDFKISVEKLNILDGTQIATNTEGQGNGGNIIVTASESIKLRGTPDRKFSSSLSTGTRGVGNAGKIEITTKSLSLQDGGIISTATFGRGNGGDLTINADSVELIGTSANFPSMLRASTEGNESGKAGNLTITTGKLSIQKGAAVSSATRGSGRGGNLSVTASDSIEVSGAEPTNSILRSNLTTGTAGSGQAGDLTITTGKLTIQGGGVVKSGVGQGHQGQGGNLTVDADFVEVTGTTPDGIFGSILDTQTEGTSNAGILNINTGKLIIRGGGQVSSSTLGEGSGNTLTINASESIEVNGVSPKGLRLESGIVSETLGTGNAGNVTLTTPKLSIQNGGLVSSRSGFGGGDAGNITVKASELVELFGRSEDGAFGSGLLSSTSGAGKAGDIEITTAKLIAQGGSVVSTATFGTGLGGDLTINANSVELTGRAPNGSFSSGLFTGTGNSSNAGDLTITTGNLLVSDGAEVATSTLGKGNAGNILIQATDFIFLNTGGVVRTDSIGQGNAGSVTIDSPDALIVLDGFKIINILSPTGAIVSTTLTPSSIISFVQSVDGLTGDRQAGDITIKGRSLSLTNGARLSASTFGKGNAGNIQIDIAEAATFDNVVGIFSTVEAGGVGNAGTVNLTANSISLTRGGSISTLVRQAAQRFDGSIIPAGRGNGGDVSIKANDIFVDGFTFDLLGNLSSSGVFSQIDQGAMGNAGNIDIQATDSLTLSNGAAIVSTLGFNAVGRGGNITIKGANLISVSDGSQMKTDTSGQGDAGTVTIDAPNAFVFFDGITILDNEVNPSGIVTVVKPLDELTSDRQGGDINITAKSLSITNGAEINARTEGQGNAGNVIVNVSDVIAITGAFSGILTSVESSAIGQGGNISITGESLLLTDGATIATDTFGIGNAGNIKLDIREQIKLKDFASLPFDGTNFPLQTSIATGVGLGAIGNAGTIDIKAQSLSLDNFSLITSATSGYGNAADISIEVDDFLSLNQLSTIESLVGEGAEGNSGDIIIQSRSLTLTNGSQLQTLLVRERNGLPGGKGEAGDIIINATDSVDISGVSQTQLPVADPFDPTQLLPTEGFSSGLFASTEKGASGNAGTIVVTTNAFRVADGAVVNAFTANSGDAQNITINANTLEVTGGGQVIASTRNSGKAGNITLNITEILTLSGSDPNFANRLAQFGEDIVNNQGAESGLFAQTEGQGIAGSIIINTPIFNIADSAIVSAKTSNAGDGGNININAPNSVTLGNNSQLTVETSGAGKAGDIDITTDTLTIGKDAQLSATATETATNPQGGGSITLNTSNLNLSGKLGIFAETQGESPAGNLKLNPNNNNLNLNINFTDNGFISASTTAAGDGGNINISAPQVINIQGDGKIAVETSGSGNAGTIDITSQTLNLADGLEISASTTGEGNAGNINLNANQINLEQTQINAFTNSTGNAGSITLSHQGNNANQVNLSNNSRISTEIQSQGQSTTPSNIAIKTDNLHLDNSTITASTSGKGNAGSITVPNAQNISLNQSEITASTSGEGDTGIIDLNAADNLQLDNSEISSSVEQGAVGNSQQITINTPNLNLNNSEISVATAGEGNAGSILIPNANTVNLDNSIISSAIAPSGIATQPSNITLNTQQLNLTNNSQITATTSGTGEAGKISITAHTLDITGNAKIQTNTNSSGKAGNITFAIQDSLNLNSSTIEASTAANSTGDGGSIIIDPITVNLNNGAQITVNSQGQGNGGSIFLTANKLNLNNASSINATTASGEGGNITLQISDILRLDNNSPITATAGGTGNGGNITINSDFLIARSNSDITANAFEGKGGNIKITATGILLDPDSNITASSQFGLDGVVETNTPNNDPSQGLIDLPDNVVNPNDLIAENVCRKSANSEFTITGRGGLPSNPEQMQNSEEVEVRLVAPTEETATPVNVTPTSVTPRNIIPAQGWIRNDKGEFVLVAYNPQENSPQRQQQNLSVCQPR